MADVPANDGNDGKSDKLPINSKPKPKTRRGTGRGKQKTLQFSLLGNNANGIKGKQDSLKNAINFFKRPSCITLQECKLKSQNMKIPGYQVFFKNRTTGGGGGLITAVEENLASIQVSSSENDILVIEVEVGDHRIRVINGYGPQEAQNHQERKTVHDFWQEMENQIIKAKDDHCKIIIQCDANAKLGNKLFSKDLHNQTENGSILYDIIQRQNLHILNTDQLCSGSITRHRSTKCGEEKSILDFIMVCDGLKICFEEMVIDEARAHVLTKYSTTKGVQTRIESDHNVLFAKFGIKYQEVRLKTKREIFNFKNSECQKSFYEVTNNTTKLSSCFNKNNNNFLKQADNFMKKLNGTFHQCFTKIRIKNKTSGPKVKDDIQIQLQLKTNTQLQLKEAKSVFVRTFLEEKIEQISNAVSKLSADKNAKIIKDQLGAFNNFDGTFSGVGMWKIKSKLFPQNIDPPMAKKDNAGNLITSIKPLKMLYLETYVHRLRHRPMREELHDLLELKNTLWEERLNQIKNNISKCWQLCDLEKVIKSLKNNQTRDPHGMINELFKPGVIGQDLKKAVLDLMNGIKKEMVMPPFMELSNITTLYKSKGSRLDMDSDRGIFILTVLRKILDKLLYNDKYKDIESGMSDSNIGARKKQNIKNHLFVVYGIMNSVIYEEKGCMDISTYDLIKCFDALWIEDCLNDLHDTLEDNQHDDKLALIYESNRNNMVAVKTPVGLTNRVNIQKIVTQGGTFGPIECANSVDKIGQKCYDSGENLFIYKKIVRVLPLSYVDDLLTLSRCGAPSLEMNTFINAQIETKKLRFHTPDINGKSKCNYLHVGKPSKLCPELQVHGTKMERVTEVTYLGDIISEDAKNTKNLKQRISKGLGIITKIMNILETVTLGEHYFSTAVLLRESMFLNGILTNIDVWYGLNQGEIDQLDDLDKSLLRQIFKTKISTPAESLFLELGVINVKTIIQSRRINYLHYLSTRDDSKMLSKFFNTQWKYPGNSREWTEQAKGDLEYFGIQADFNFIKSKSEDAFKNLVKRKAKETFFIEMMNKKISHTKMDDCFYTELKMQTYLKSSKFSAVESQLIYSFRTRMANFQENFPGNSGHNPCPLCLVHLDSQALCLQCPMVKSEIDIKGKIDDIFSEDIPMEIVNTLTKVMKLREG